LYDFKAYDEILSVQLVFDSDYDAIILPLHVKHV